MGSKKLNKRNKKLLSKENTSESIIEEKENIQIDNKEKLKSNLKNFKNNIHKNPN